MQNGTTILLMESVISTFTRIKHKLIKPSQKKLIGKDVYLLRLFTPTGEWHENNKEGWWTEEGKRNWKIEFERFISSLDEDIMVTVVDCHM